MCRLEIIILLLVNLILAVKGSVLRKGKYLSDTNESTEYQSTHSNYPRVNFDKDLKREVHVWRSLHNRLYPVPSDGNKISFNLKNNFAEIELPFAQREKCQTIKGLPDPASGCCGVELSRMPVLQKYRNCPTKYARFDSPEVRLQRSTGSRTPPTKMILGGSIIEPHHLPWMARIIIQTLETPQLHGVSVCGGTIISSRFVLTAAHCLDNYKEPSQLEVILAEYDTYGYPKDYIDNSRCIENVIMKVDHVVIHQNYNETYLQNDVALLRLSSDIPYTEFIRPICLAASDVEDLQDKNFIVGGWGLNGQRDPNLKQAAFFNYVANNKCTAQYSFKDESMFCSKGKHGADIGHGDSGGPLMVYVNNTYFLSGVVSGKRTDYNGGYLEPSLFNNVFYHTEWIIEHVK